MIKKAFTLIELSTYLAVFSFFIFLVFSFFRQTQNAIFLNLKDKEKIVRNFIAIDLLKRDLICASSNKCDWDLKNFVFKKNYLDKKNEKKSICIGWKAENKNGLSRIEGQYDFILKKWGHKIISPVNKQIKNFNFDFKSDKCNQSIDSIEFNFSDENKEIVFLKNVRI